MGLFKSLVEFSTKWKLIDKHGWGAGLLYEDEINKRKLDKLDREYSNILEEGKKDYFKIGDDIIKNNKYITKEEKEELFSILSKIDNTNDSDLVIMLGNELKTIGRKIIFNNYIRDVLMQINDVVMNNEKVYPLISIRTGSPCQLLLRVRPAERRNSRRAALCPCAHQLRYLLQQQYRHTCRNPGCH